MKRKNATKLRDILLIGGLVVMLSSTLFGNWMLLIGAIITCSCLIPHFLYNKCPHCGKQLGRNEGKFCQFCGGPLD